MAEVNKISSFKSFSEIKSQESEMKLREENSLKKQETLVKIEEILDEMGLSSLSEIDEDSQQTFISKLLGIEKTNEGNAFVYAAGKAKAEGKDEFEFNGKTYKVTIKDTGIKEGNAFGDAVTKAKDAGEKEFEFEGKTYKVEENLDEAISRSEYDRMDGLHNTKAMDALINSADTIFADLTEEMFEFSEIVDFIAMKLWKSKLSKTYESYVVTNEALSLEQKKVERFLNNLAKEFDYSIQDAARFVIATIKVMGLNESIVNEARIKAPKALQELVDGNTSRAEGIKMSKDLAEHYLMWLRTSPYGKKQGQGLPLDMVIKASFNWGIERGLDPKLKGELDALKETVKESIEINEGAVKQFEKDLQEMISDIKKGFGWISPDYVEDTWEMSSDSIDFNLVKNEIFNRLIAGKLLAFEDPEKEDMAGQYVKSLKELGIKESLVNEATIELDSTDPKDKNLAKLLKKNNVSLEVINKKGPSGYPEVKLTGEVKDLKTVLADSEYGWDDESLEEYIEESVEVNEEIDINDRLSELMNKLQVQIGNLKTSTKDAAWLKQLDSIISAFEKLEDRISIASKKLGMIPESLVNEAKEMYKIAIDTEVEDSKIGNKFYSVKKGEKVELIDDDGEIATVKLKSGEIVNIESEYVIESLVNEAEIKSDDEFKEYVMAVLKKAFGADFDEAKATEVADGILKKSDGDYGAAVGMLTSSLA